MALGVLCASAALAQNDEPGAIHWAYSAYFGTGRYRVAGTETAYVLSGRPGWTLREAAFDDGERTVGIRLRVPVALGAHRFDTTDIGAALEWDNVATLSAVPGVELEVPVNTRWSIKPLVYAGGGSEIDGSTSAFIYWGGLKSEGRFRAKSFDWALVNGLTLVGYSAEAGERGRVLAALTGFDFDHPLATKKINGHGVHIHWHVSFTEYFDEVDIRPSARADPVSIEDEWEIGAAFSAGEQRLGVAKLRWDRVGLAYRFSSDGNFEGVSLYFRSLFDR